MTLGQRIQEGRLRLGLSQEGLGEKLGVSRQAVSRWEADGAVPDTDKLIALSRLFGITLNELLQVENPPAREPAPAEPPSPPPKGRRRGRTAAILLGALLIAAAAGVLAGGNAALARRVAALEEELEALRTEVRAAEAGSLAADWGFRPGLENSAGLSVRFTVTAARYDPEEDMQVYFLLDGEWLRAHRAEARREEGGVYAASVCLDRSLLRDFTLSAVFVRDGVEYVESLVEFDYLAAGGSSWRSLTE